MRPITKILLLLVVAFIVYLVWPRTASLRDFRPAELARLEVDAWKAEKAGDSTKALVARYQIYTSQFHFSPLTAFRLARIDADVISSLKNSRGENSTPAEENRVLNALTEKYSTIKSATQGTFEPDSVAREEVARFSFLLDGAPINEIAAPFSRILALIYGGDPAQFAEAATNIEAAHAAVFGTGPIEDVDAAGGPVGVAQEGYRVVQELAKTPPVAAGQEG